MSEPYLEFLLLPNKARCATRGPDGSKKERTEYLWGYGTGVVAATTPDYGDVVLAEFTQTIERTDVTYFQEVFHHAVLTLDAFSIHLAADAAFDAWYVYQHPALHGGIAAVQLNAHTKTTFEPDGVVPLYPIGLRMHPTYRYAHPYGYHQGVTVFWRPSAQQERNTRAGW